MASELHPSSAHGPPPEKKLRLALEDATAVPQPTSDKPLPTSAAAAVPYDVTEKGFLVYKPPLSTTDRLNEQVFKLWSQNPNLRGLPDTTDASSSEPSIADPEKTPDTSRQKAEEGVGNSVKDDDDDSNPSTETQRSISEMQQHLHEQLFHAHSEVGVAFDVVNQLLAYLKPAAAAITTGATTNGSSKTSDPLAVLAANKAAAAAAASQPLPLPANAISFTYINPSKPDTSAQILKAKLGLAAKRSQLKAASQILSQHATSLETVINEEHSFWKQALELRQKNWIIQSRKLDEGKIGGRDNIRSTFHVLYGYENGKGMKNDS
ncbi:subunit 17 of mediator complex-domain-containing protein [Dimargaris cristalligena]|uniref:Mediator of RNA polymerase II transcription subunit 17 n=1 Tax=Dimargaris cristalligena TaxID=215637 RepID=A0A4P9ZM04_9FUNG|nr:subunit 17 of mediator complex-domain-containing protein [Dimargaris cristalligena]|eukprot:RKP33541.1 subunit 17 of mediator complex-domain-containing protein [Dimargaris cristalligena]